MSGILIKNGFVVDDKQMKKADLLINDGLISKIDANIPESSLNKDIKVVNAEGKIVMPGLIDAHTHYHLVSRGTVTCDSFVQGSRLAAFGGVTTVVDFADHNKGMGLVDSANYRLDEMRPGMAITIQSIRAFMVMATTIQLASSWKTSKRWALRP